MNPVSSGFRMLEESSDTLTRVQHLNKWMWLECMLTKWLRSSATYPAELARGGFSSADVNAVIWYVLSRSESALNSYLGFSLESR